MDQPRTDEDQPLVARTQAGDAAAFDDLVVKYSPRLYGLVYNMTSNHEDTNDMLQDVFAKAYKSIKGFRGKSSFYTWIHSIAVNMTLNFLKKRGRRYHLSLDDVDASIQNDKEFIELTATSSPVREADLGELQRRLNEAMMKLSDEHRAVVTMFHIQGMPHAEISKILAFQKERYVPGSSTRIANCKIIWTNSAKTLFLSNSRHAWTNFDENEIGKLLRLKTARATASGLLRKFPARISSPPA